MNLLILEDEQLASDRLVSMLKEIEQDVVIVGVLKSIDRISYLSPKRIKYLIFDFFK
tara:strand:+ start:417 stop:587 length:171 start_codon:yes stop_codon:yes gene_type:complete